MKLFSFYTKKFLPYSNIWGPCLGFIGFYFLNKKTKEFLLNKDNQFTLKNK